MRVTQALAKCSSNGAEPVAIGIHAELKTLTGPENRRHAPTERHQEPMWKYAISGDRTWI